MVVGLISDTHALVRPAALDALSGVARIVHAGDVGAPEVLRALARVAPVTAVRGNNDHGAWAARLPETARIAVGAHRVLVVHEKTHAAARAPAAGIDVVVTGHSHRPLVERRDGVLFVNPGSAGPRRFSLPVTVARLVVSGDAIDATIVPLTG
jgi:putative phosphoesterase